MTNEELVDIQDQITELIEYTRKLQRRLNKIEEFLSKKRVFDLFAED